MKTLKRIIGLGVRRTGVSRRGISGTRRSGSTVFAAVLAMLGVGSLMSACHLSTELEPCETEVALNFEYKFSTSNPAQGSTELADLVDVIQLYIFDNNNGNTLVDIASVRRADIASGQLPIEILSGDYTMVAWGLGSETNNGGFANVQMIDPATNHYTKVQVGQTTLADFRTLVVNPENPTFSNLYYAISENVHVPIPTQGTTTVTTHFQFTPYTNLIRLTINGMDDVKEHIAAMNGSTTRADEEDFPLDIFLTGKNGIFTYDGSIDNGAVELTYNDTPVLYTDAQAIVEIKTLRVDVDRHSVDPLLLHIHPVGAVTDAEMHTILPDLNLLSLIQQVQDESGKPLLSTQDQIDEATEIPIEITIERVPANPPVNPPGGEEEDTEYTLKVISIKALGWEIENVENINVVVDTRR